ncbi:uncharacterized protein LOC141531999 [Cotesia typhae]|uniref:uncharacterized protein LOC141531999 n=1 Tax=Cotesia typhae TaxID=2053667 RepID=UPI003D687049
MENKDLKNKVLNLEVKKEQCGKTVGFSDNHLVDLHDGCQWAVDEMTAGMLSTITIQLHLDQHWCKSCYWYAPIVFNLWMWPMSGETAWPLPSTNRPLTHISNIMSNCQRPSLLSATRLLCHYFSPGLCLLRLFS